MTLVRDRRVQLRAVEPGDLPRLYELEHDALLGNHWRFPGPVANRTSPANQDFDAYVERFTAGLLLAVVIESTGISGELVGMAYAFNVNARMASAELGLVATPSPDGAASARARLLTSAGFAFFVNHLFEEYPLNRLFAWVQGTNLARFPSIIGPIFDCHATLDQHVHTDPPNPSALGAAHLLSVPADRWNSLYRPRVLARLRSARHEEEQPRV